MKVFISSVRRGLEAERDALPGLILAIGHDPKRFEDYTAQGVPSREACLRGVTEADAYLLMLGPNYGDPLPDTGLSPTEEEWTRALSRGIPILVFRKRDVEMDDREVDFASRVESYVDGRFRGAFSGVADLLVGAASAIRNAAASPPALVWTPLSAALATPWRTQGDRLFQAATATTLECHVLPVGAVAPLTATVLSALPTRLGRVGRDVGLFEEDRALDSGVREGEAYAITRDEPRRLAAGVRMRDDRVVSVWSELGVDMLGVILDPADVASRIGLAIRVAADLNLSGTDEVAFSVGLRNLNMVTIGSAAELGVRRGTTLARFGQTHDAAQVEARDSVPFRALGSGRGEISNELATRLLLRFRALAR